MEKWTREEWSAFFEGVLTVEPCSLGNFFVKIYDDGVVPIEYGGEKAKLIYQQFRQRRIER